MLRLITLLLVMLASASAWGQQLPQENPDSVYVKGRKVSHSWREGRIWVPASELKPLLNLDTEERVLDLIEALEEKGGYVYEFSGGRFEARRDRSQYSSGSSAKAVAENLTSVFDGRRSLAVGEGWNLEYYVKSVTTNAGDVETSLVVYNTGKTYSKKCEVVCEFQDSEGYTFALGTLELSSLAPKQEVSFDMSGEFRAQDRARASRIKEDGVKVSFLNRASKSTTTASQPRKRKKNGLRKQSLDFNRGYGRINRARVIRP